MWSSMLSNVMPSLWQKYCSSAKSVDWKNEGLYTCRVWLSEIRWSSKEDRLKDKMQKDKLIRCLPVSLSFLLLQTTTSHIITVCKLFSCNAKQHMPFWLLKEAWLTCNRCPFSALPTPFWSPIRHLFERFDNQLIDCWLRTCFFAYVCISPDDLFGIM